MMPRFPRLFEPLTVRGFTLKNCIMSTGYVTTLPVDGTVNAALVAYHEARARGGAVRCGTHRGSQHTR